MLRPTFLSFETAKRALATSQMGLDTVGHNIANVNTQGYTRQRVDQVSLSFAGSTSKYQTYGRVTPGMGSAAIGVNQIRDPFLDRRFRTEAAGCGEYNAISNGLGEINAVFDEILTTGSHSKMSEFLDALDKLAATADSKEHATVLRNKAEQMAQILNSNSTSLDNVEKQIRSGMDQTVTNINSILEQIAHLNTKIRDDNFYGNPSNELNDQRNRLLDQLAEYVDIDIKRTPVPVSGGIYLEQLSVEIRGSGNANKGIDPIVLVDGGSYNGLATQYDEKTGEASIHFADAYGTLSLISREGGKTSDITDAILTGELKGHLNVLNGKGNFALSGENGFRGIPYYRQALDDYAASFADTMNRLNEVQVYGPNGPYTVNGEALTISRPLFVSKDGGPITAASLAVSDEWKHNAQYIENAKKNNALYVNNDPANPSDPNFYLFTAGENGPVKTGIKIEDVAGVDKDGFLVDANGKKLQADGSTVLSDQDVAVNIKDLQRAITEATTYYDFNLLDHTSDGTPDGTVYVKDGNTYKDTGVAAKDVVVGDDGILYNRDATQPDQKGTKLTTTINGKTVTVTKDILFKNQPGAPGVDYKEGDPAPNGLLPGASANDNLLQIKAALTGSTRFPNGFSGNYQEYMTSFQGDMALDKELNDAMLDASLNVLYGLADSRDAISAVSIDEEGINMMTYQNFYNAAARYMTVLDEALGTIIQNMGVIGR